MMLTKPRFTVSVSPHIRDRADTRSIMLDVLIALVPALVVSVLAFGMKALLLEVISVGSAVFWEWLYRKLMKKPQAIGDLSAAVTGLLLSFCLSPEVAWWMPIIGTFFAIVVVKQLYGGIGKNFLNPALAGRAFLSAAYPGAMTTWSASRLGADALTGATPLASMAASQLPETGVLGLFLGTTGGCMGEVSALALLIGGVYLLCRRVITPRIPLSYLLTVAVLTFLFPRGNDNLSWMLSSLCSGGLMLGAIYMATDYATSPVTRLGQIIFGVGCGLLTVFIRYFGSYPEGVSYAILIMNVTVWLIDKATMPRRFGVSRGKKKEAA